MDKTQVRLLIIRPALRAINMWSANAEELLMGTAAQESKLFTYVRQEGVIDNSIGGFGPFQEEPPTFNDLYARLIKGKPLEDTIMSICNFKEEPPIQMLMWHLAFAAMMCRIKYEDAPGELPDASNVSAMAAYWKEYYNTPRGEGTTQEFINNYNLYVKG